MKEQTEIARGMPVYLEYALEHMLSSYEENIGGLNSALVADLASIKHRLVETYGALPDELQPAFDGLADRLGVLVDRGGALTSITDITAEMKAEFISTTEGANELTAALAAMPAELKPALDEMLAMAETNLGGLSDAFLDTITQIRDNLTGLYNIPAELASRLNTLIDSELALDSAARVANAALSDQSVASLRAADAKGNLAEAADKLGFSEDEARQLIQEANYSMNDQQIAAYVAGEKKKSLAEIAEDLGKTESELAEILERANAGLEKQTSLAAAGASALGTGGNWRVGAQQNIANMSLPANYFQQTPMMPDWARSSASNPYNLPYGRGGGGGGGDTRIVYVTIKAGALMGNEQEAREFSRKVGDYLNQDTRRHSSAVKL
jgi:molybdenum-dependent DNA-binding transcriptional regulator ModE